MKKIAKILIALGIGLIVAGTILWKCNQPNPTPPPPAPTVSVDTTKYTDVVLINNSKLDSVEVFITLEHGNSIVGKFGMTKANIYDSIACYCPPENLPCKGSFWAKKGVPYHLGDTNVLNGVMVTFGAWNRECQGAIDAGYPHGLNNFEFNVNTWWQEGKVTGNGESFDITLVDGLHCILRQTATSTGPRNSNGLNPNFSAFWDFGPKDKYGKLLPFITSTNGPTFATCINIPAVYPYGCDHGNYSQKPPTPICFPIKCSDKWGVNASQTNRQGQGGRVTCEFLGFIGEPANK